jgi:hypothetical protein
MSSSLAFIVVEDRQNETLALCRRSAALAQEDLVVLSSTQAGPAYAQFRDAYVHLSSNSAEFEMICFRRYFLLAQHLAAHPECRAFVLIDSDVLVFRGIRAHIERLVGKADFSGSFIRPSEAWDPCQISPHVSYWTSEGLLGFVAYVLQTYTTPEGRSRLRAIANRFVARGTRGGISDMTLLHLWAHATGNVAPINRQSGGGAIDHNINSAHNLFEYEFSMRGGAKRIAYVDGQPCLATPSGELVKALALHFQGSAKIAMAHALHGRTQMVAELSFVLLMARRAKNAAYRFGGFARKAMHTLRIADARAAE